MSPVLDKEEAEYRANNASSITSEQRSAKNRATAAKYETIRERTCGSHKTKLGEILLGYLKDRAAQRATMLESNKSRFGGR